MSSGGCAPQEDGCEDPKGLIGPMDTRDLGILTANESSAIQMETGCNVSQSRMLTISGPTLKLKDAKKIVFDKLREKKAKSSAGDAPGSSAGDARASSASDARASSQPLPPTPPRPPPRAAGNQPCSWQPRREFNPSANANPRLHDQWYQYQQF